ncbi:hypothetical protein Poly21_12200 [Allorhodopirellula heiligendammensis]|uniref:Uncharacterized protein n=1 Tax=Allorhodopirellula heiligendammensis TaxID=2714739 RepID=A0A5C6C8H1_9BACT|nr:hypothetical protein Poly21_12200 [Allorhodopirellula heiligendammensis]
MFLHCSGLQIRQCDRHGHVSGTEVDESEETLASIELIKDMFSQLSPAHHPVRARRLAV